MLWQVVEIAVWNKDKVRIKLERADGNASVTLYNPTFPGLRLIVGQSITLETVMALLQGQPVDEVSPL